MELDVWMRESEYYYDYIAIHIDDLLIASKDLEDIINMLLKKHKFKLKGTRSIKYHLGYNFYIMIIVFFALYLRSLLRK